MLLGSEGNPTLYCGLFDTARFLCFSCVNGEPLSDVRYWRCKSKGKVYRRTGHECPEGEWSYSSPLSLTSALDEGGCNATPRPLYPRERPGTHCVGGWVGPRAGLDVSTGLNKVMTLVVFGI